MPMTWQKLNITDGTVRINIFEKLCEWYPQLALTKDGGAWAGSSYSQGRQLFDKQLSNIVDTFILNLVTAGGQAGSITLVNSIIDLLDKGVSYWMNSFQSEMVWIELQTRCQDDTQYAIVVDYNIPQLDTLFSGPYDSNGLLREVQLSIEHGLWLENPPATETAIELQSSNSLIAAATGQKDIWITGYWSDEPITHIFVYDAAPVTWTNITGASGVNLLPAVPAVGDILYIGVQDNAPVETAHFDNIVFNIGAGAAGMTIVAEYSTGAAFAGLPVAGYQWEDNTNFLANTGRNIVVWDPVGGATPWNSFAVNGITAYWIRFRVTAAPGPLTTPTQVTDAIYTQQTPYFDVDELQVPGTYPALAEVKLYCEDASEGGVPAGRDVWHTDVIHGLRSLDRGTNFSAFLNATSTTTLPSGVAWSIAGALVGTSVLDRYSPVRYTTQYAPGGADPKPGSQIGQWIMSIPESYEYVGRYRAFLRVYAADSDFLFRISIAYTGTTTPLQYSDWARVSSDAAVQVAETLDLGIIEITQPVSIQDDYSIYITAIGAHDGAGAVVARVQDLVLMPIDELSYQTTLPLSSSVLFDALRDDKYLMTDSISSPKIPVSGELYGSPFSSSPFQAAWQVLTPNEIFWQANKDQRLWILMMQEDNISTGGNGHYASGFHLGSTPQGWREARYKALR